MNQNNEKVIITDISGPATLYRVGRLTDSTGLWYDQKGKQTNLIKTLDGAAAALLPMGPHKVFQANGMPWISTTHSIDTLKLWFPEPDMIQLAARGYGIQEIKVSGYRHLQFEQYGHEVYTPSQVIDFRVLGNSYQLI